jgi:hypothetical protein
MSIQLQPGVLETPHCLIFAESSHLLIFAYIVDEIIASLETIE